MARLLFVAGGQRKLHLVDLMTYRLHAGLLLAVFLLSAVATPQPQSGIVNISYGRSWPHSIVVDSARQLVYVNGLSGIYPPEGFTFGVISAVNRTLSEVVPLPGTAGELALDDETGTVYAASNDSVSVFDGQSGTFTRTFDLRMPVFGLAFDSSTGYLLLTSHNSVFQLDPASGTLLRNATVGDSAEYMAVVSAKGVVFVSNYLSSSLTVLRTTDLSTVTTIQLPFFAYPSRLALDDDRGILYVTTGGTTIEEVSLTDYSYLGSLTVTKSNVNGTYDVSVDGSRNRLFVLTEPGSSVTELDASTGTTVASFGLDSDAVEIAVDQPSGLLYVTDYHQVTVISPVDVPTVPQRAAEPGQAAALAGTIAAALVGLYVWMTTPSGGRRDDLPSQQRRDPSSSPCSLLPLSGRPAR